MALHTWEDGENIYAEYLNGNVDYLLDTTTTKLSALETEINADIAELETQIAANAAAIEELETSLSEINDNISEMLANIAPDYSSAKTISSGWTATGYGWINWLSQANDNTTVYLRINGTVVGYHSHYKYGDCYRLQYMVSKGDVVTFSSNTSARFFPCKGA